MSDKGTLLQLKGSVEQVYNNAQSYRFLTPQKHYNMIVDVIDTLSPSYGTASGTDDYEVSMSVTQVAYSNHKLYLIAFDETNTGDATLDVDSLGETSLTKDALSELSAGDIVAGKIYEVRYDSSNLVFVINI